MFDHVECTVKVVNFNLYDKDDASRRRIMRTYGVQYELTKNEVNEEVSQEA